MKEPSKVTRGEDKLIVCRLINKKLKIYYDLTGFTKITVKFKKSDNSWLEKVSELAGAVKASVVFQSITFTAVTAGTTGNSISLVFNGTDSIDTVVGAWNTANPANQVSFTGRPGTTIPTAGTAQLSGGVNDSVDVSAPSPINGKVEISLRDIDTSLLKLGLNQSFLVIVDFGTTRRIARFANSLSVYDE